MNRPTAVAGYSSLVPAPYGRMGQNVSDFARGPTIEGSIRINTYISLCKSRGPSLAGAPLGTSRTPPNLERQIEMRREARERGSSGPGYTSAGAANALRERGQIDEANPSGRRGGRGSPSSSHRRSWAVTGSKSSNG
jgi:hypothetical protein